MPGLLGKPDQRGIREVDVALAIARHEAGQLRIAFGRNFDDGRAPAREPLEQRTPRIEAQEMTSLDDYRRNRGERRRAVLQKGLRRLMERVARTPQRDEKSRIDEDVLHALPAAEALSQEPLRVARDIAGALVAAYESLRRGIPGGGRILFEE